MTIRNLEQMLAPDSVALIGASSRTGSVGNWLAANLARDFKGPLHFVNARGGSIAGREAVRSIAELPRPPSLAIVATPAETVPKIIAELGGIGTRAVVVITAGISGELRQQMLDAAKPFCLRLLGPNCIGLMLPHIGLNASFSHIAAPRGDLAFLSQSGALITGILDWAADRRIGFSHVVSLGDMADVDFGDMLDYLAGETESRAVLIYMEALTHARKFMSAARRAARVKPVIVIKAGRHAAGARAATSHTGALAGLDAAYDAAFRRAGLLRVFDLGELFAAAETVSRLARLKGERLTIVTNGGGAGVLATDRVVDLDGRLAELQPETIARLDDALPATWSRSNPIDIIGDAGPERYAAAVDAAMSDPATDALLVMNCPTAITSSTEAARAVIETRDAMPSQLIRSKPIISTWLGEKAASEARALFAEAGIPTFETPSDAVNGYMQLVAHARAQAQLMRAPPSRSVGLDPDIAKARAIIDAAASAGRIILSEVEAKGLLAAYAIPTVETIVAATVDEVGTAATTILARAPGIVVKILSDDISHKSDAGGVILDIASPEAAIAAAQEMLTRISARMPNARIAGFTVQAMIRRPGAHELILGMNEDRTFGPIIMFGAGGTSVEVDRDTALALPPLDLKLAEDLIGSTRIARRLRGYRDKPAADIDAIADTLVKLSQLVADHPAIRELDINPLLADALGVIALDARVRIQMPADEPRRPMALRPYPIEWERVVTSTALGPILLRPIRPEDEHLYEAFFARVTPSDRRMRFFTPIKGLSHDFLARLTQVDYAREIAFVAISDAGELLGVARFNADPDYEHAEFGLLVRSDLKGRGLGRTLMGHLIAYARSEGLRQLTGEVLAENAAMLRLTSTLGFESTFDRDDPTVRHVTLDLT